MKKLSKIKYPKTGKIRRFVIRIAHLQEMHKISVKRDPEWYAGKSKFISMHTVKHIWKWA